MFYYFLFICTLYLGFFKLPSSLPGLIYDILFIPLIVYSAQAWKKPLKNDLVEKVLIIFWNIFIIYYSVRLVASEKYYSKVTSLLNIREMYPYLLFYVSIIIINSKEKLKKAIIFMLAMSVIATIFTVIQSIYGPKPMFDIKGFYNIGHWAGQGTVMIGPISRVILPTMYLVYIVFIGLILYNLIKGELKFLMIILALTIAILISFTRSFWLAITISGIFTVILLLRNSLITKNTFYISFILLLITAGILLVFIMQSNPISHSLSDRLLSIFSDVQNRAGTYNIRLINLQRFLDVWKSFGIFLGVDPFFIGHYNEPTLSDVGFVYVLVTIGLIGLLLLASIWIVGFRYAIIMLKTGSREGIMEMSTTGAILFASIIFFIICQVYTQFSFTSSLFALIFGTSVATKRIFNV